MIPVKLHFWGKGCCWRRSENSVFIVTCFYSLDSVLRGPDWSTNKFLTGKMLNIYLIPTVPLFIHLYHHIIHVSTQEYFLGYITSTERVPFFSRHQLRMWCRLIPTVLENKILGVAAPVSFQCIAAAPMAEETLPTAKCTNSFKHL